MLQQTLIPGIKFAARFLLTANEANILQHFLNKPYTCTELSEFLGINRNTLYSVLQRLKSKELIVLKDRDSVGNGLYQFNIELLE